jgi:hypothetical protein
MQITFENLTDDERRYLEVDALLEEKCAERAADLDPEAPDSAVAVQAARDVIAELAGAGIKVSLYRARDRIARILRAKAEAVG